jgi:ubiquinone/menaquinone biosynthesis C-methylase UbiE
MTTAIVKDRYRTAPVAEGYDRERFTSLAGRVFDVLERRTIRRVLAPFCQFPDYTRVLDVPCGTGRITALLLDMGLPVTGGDISPAMLDVARHRCAKFGRWLDLREMDLDRLDVPDSSYDMVTCIRLLHHLHSPARAAVLRELARVSRRYVLINVSYSSRYYRLRRTLKRGLGQGISRSSATWRQIERETRQAGLTVVAQRFVLPGISEDLVLLLEKCDPASGAACPGPAQPQTQASNPSFP